MVVLLPDKEIQFTHFLRDLKHNSITSILNLLRQRTVDLSLPRFTINYSTKLTSILKKVIIFAILFCYIQNLYLIIIKLCPTITINSLAVHIFKDAQFTIF